MGKPPPWHQGGPGSLTLSLLNSSQLLRTKVSLPSDQCTQKAKVWSLLICTRAAPCTETGYRGPAMAVASRLQTPEMGEDPSASLCLRGLWGTQKTVWDRIWQRLKPVGSLWSRPSLVLCSFLAVSQAHNLGAGAQGLGDFQAELLGGRGMSFPALEACKTEEGAEGRRDRKSVV